MNERRKTKYPDTDTFHFHNANPKGRITGDCVIRAMAAGTGETWEEVAKELTEESLRTLYAPLDRQTYDAVLKRKGWTKHAQPRKADGTKYTGAEFCKELEEQGAPTNVIAHIGGHHVVAILEHEGHRKVWDIWNSTRGCIGNYWTL